MVKKAAQSKTKSILTSWFLTQPLKFALLSFVLLVVVSVAYALIAVAITGGQTPLPSWPVGILMLLSLFFCMYKLACWLPQKEMDRRGFVAIDNGLTFIYYLFSILSLVFLIRNSDAFIYNLMILQQYSVILFWIVMVASALVYLYAFGLMIENLIVIYRRAVTMGVPKWKVILSLPFTFGIYWFPGYMLAEEKSVKSETPIKSKWYAKITDWIIERPVNAVLIFLLTVLMTALFFDIYTLSMIVVLGAVFGIWILISGVQNFRAKMGGAFATFIASINVALVLFLLGFLCFAPHVFMTDAMQAIQYEVIDTAPMMDVQYNNF